MSERKPPRRERNIHLHVMVTPGERELLNRRMDEAGMRNMGAYLRTIALKGYILKLDLSELREISMLLGSAANNINQIARRVNQTGGVYQSDIQELNEKYESLRTAFDTIRESLCGL